MSLIKDKLCFTEVLLLIFVCSTTFIEHVDLIRVRHDESISIEPETVKEKEDDIKSNPWENIMKIFDLANNKPTVKPIKGAVFGKWEKNKCNYFKNSQFSKVAYELNYCANMMLNNSSSDTTFNKYNKWSIYTASSMCKFSDEAPNCLFYDITAYSFTFGNMSKIENYILPACIDASQNWKITATCSTVKEQNYTCNNNVWIGDDDNETSKCDSIDKLIANNVKKQTKLDEKKEENQPNIDSTRQQNAVVNDATNVQIKSEAMEQTEEKTTDEQTNTEEEQIITEKKQTNTEEAKEIAEQNDALESYKEIKLDSANKIELDSRGNVNGKGKRMFVDEGKSHDADKITDPKDEPVRSADEEKSNSAENEKRNDEDGESNSTIKAEGEEKRNLVSKEDEKSVSKKKAQSNSKEKAEHLISKVEDENKKQKIIEPSNSPTNSNNILQFAFCERMEILSRMLIATFTLIAVEVVI